MNDRAPPTPRVRKLAAILHGALPLALLLVLAGECWVARRDHRTIDQLQQALTDATPREQVFALYIIANRDQPEDYDRRSLRRLLRADNVLLRELMMTPNMMRFGAISLRRRFIEERLADPVEIFRSEFLLKYRVGNSTPITLEDLRRFLDATRDGS
jgi:hypothetical protein